MNDLMNNLPGIVESVVTHDNMTFTTTKSRGDENFVLNGAFWMVKHPTLDDVSLMLKSLKNPSDNYFAILQAGAHDGVLDMKKLVGNCGYIQVGYLHEDGDFGRAGEYCVETHFLYGALNDDGTAGEDFRTEQFRKNTTRFDEVEQLFLSFLQGNTPDVKGWTNVT